MIVVSTNGVPVRTYVGTRLVERDPDTGRLDPIQVAAAQLREDCEKDLVVTMRDFRYWLRKGLHGW